VVSPVHMVNLCSSELHPAWLPWQRGGADGALKSWMACTLQVVLSSFFSGGWQCLQLALSAARDRTSNCDGRRR
jgi:hypothetical protein